MDTHPERVPYPAAVYAQSHISRLASMAQLFGLTPPDLKNCRVLELGAGRGLHLISLALAYPDAQFVGFDISESATASAADLAQSVGATNVTFRTVDVAQVVGREGECDYLIAHGLYSWVPPATRERILELCGRVLAPQGVAFVSFNAYPGWHLRQAASDMMDFHTRADSEPGEKVQNGLALLATVIRTIGEETPVGHLLRSEASLLSAKNPAVIYHDEFSDLLTPLYFRDFALAAQSHGLQYLAEAEFAAMQTENIGAEAHEFLQSLPDVIAREQYIDFFTVNRFRQTLLCKDSVSIDRAGVNARFKGMFIGSPLRSTAIVDIASDTPATFESQLGSSVTVIQPFAKAVLDELTGVWPSRLSFADLLDRATARMPEPVPDADETLLRMLKRMYAPGLLEVEVEPYRFAATVTERPAVNNLVRLQAAAGAPVTSLRHATIDLDDDVARTLLRILDGTRDRSDMLQHIRLAGHEITEELLEGRLERMLALSLLVA